MKANAPERIWVDPTNDLQKLSGHIDKDSVEYIRKEAFIDKASRWIEENIKKWNENIKVHWFRGMTPLMIIEFKNYMKGE